MCLTTGCRPHRSPRGEVQVRSPYMSPRPHNVLAGETPALNGPFMLQRDIINSHEESLLQFGDILNNIFFSFDPN